MQFNSIFLISNDYDLAHKIGMDLWEIRKSWTLIKTDDYDDYNFKKYIKENKSIVIIDSKCFEKITPNKFIEYCEKYKILPLFITHKKNDERIQHTMYVALEEIFMDSLEYFHADEDKDSYNDFIAIIKNYLW